MGSRVGTGAILLVVGATLVACDGADEAEHGVADESAPVAAGVIRPVSAEDFPAALQACLEEAGFAASGTASDGSLEYGPYDEAQGEDLIRAEEVCRAQYPLEQDYARDATTEDWIEVYEHQRDVWVPCMRQEFGIDLGQVPSQEAFLANRSWVDTAQFRLDLEQAVSDGLLADLNAWVRTCPDYPPST